MPELPEVETVANGVNERVKGQRIESVWLSSMPQTFKTPPGEMAELLEGRRIERVRRVGKHIVFDLGLAGERSGDAGDGDESDGDAESARHDSGAFTGAGGGLRPAVGLQWIVHLGMTGRLLVNAPEVPVPKHTHAILGLSSGRELRFVDPRRFGRLAVHLLTVDSGARGGDRPANDGAAGGSAASGGFLGPGREPLSIPVAEFKRLFRGRRLAIKAALLNQRLLHGVGNIYADEGLFRAGIRPRRMAGRLRGVELERLHASLQAVLREAIDLGGSSVSDYVDADGERGFFQLKHKVYMRTGLPCLVCNTPIRKIVLGGRSTHFCPGCQR